ncbi:hypothetical protein RP20_CCG011090 [Aedes albopictus]|nr:hypothetical protein RP20_CCG011090 [Aedes albopictus]
MITTTTIGSSAAQPQPLHTTSNERAQQSVSQCVHNERPTTTTNNVRIGKPTCAAYSRKLWFYPVVVVRCGATEHEWMNGNKPTASHSQPAELHTRTEENTGLCRFQLEERNSVAFRRLMA